MMILSRPGTWASVPIQMSHTNIRPHTASSEPAAGDVEKDVETPWIADADARLLVGAKGRGQVGVGGSAATATERRRPKRRPKKRPARRIAILQVGHLKLIETITANCPNCPNCPRSGSNLPPGSPCRC